MPLKSSRLLLYLGVAIVCTLVLIPIYWLLVTAISPVAELRGGSPNFWPESAQWNVFLTVLQERPIVLWLQNSLLVAFGSVLLSMTVSAFAAYGLSRVAVPGSGTMGIVILTAKMLPATLLVIPLFGVFRSLGLIGDTPSIILAHSTMIIPFATWMLKGYFDTIPRELEQAAMVDGCSAIGAFFRVVLPVATPGLAATALYGFVLSWSDYVYARTFLANRPDNWTANLGITTMKGEYVTDWNEIFAAAVLITLPVIAVYFYLERYLVSGLASGAEK